jgi:PilZ domain
MDSINPKQTSARAFIRSLNILLKYARLYGFDHTRTAEQFDTAWNELQASIPAANESGLLLSAAGSQLLLDGLPIDASPAERSFAQLLSAAGLASIQFTSRVTKEDLERLARAFPTSNTKPAALAEKLKAALAGSNIRINEVRFVAEDSSKSEALASGPLAAQSLGAKTEKLRQSTAAADEPRGDAGGGPEGNSGDAARAGTPSGLDGHASAVTGAAWAISGVQGRRPYSGKMPGGEVLQRGEAAGPTAGGVSPESGTPGPSQSDSAAAGSGGTRGADATESGISTGAAKDEEILGILKLLTSLGHTVTGQGGGLEAGPLQEEITKLPPQSQEMLRKALAAVAAQAPASRAKGPMLLRLAEHLAVKFAVERYERGEVKVNAVRQMFEKMSQEIDGLRKILGVHEQKLANAGVIVESTADLLDRQFWMAVPERNKLGVLASPEAWCIPARNIRQFVEELLQRGDEKAVLGVLQNYVYCLQSEEIEARRRTAIGIADLADLYASLAGRPLAPAIQIAGAQLSLEREDTLQGLVSAAFVRLAQEAGLKRLFPAVLQSLDSLEAVEHHRLALAQSLRPRIGLEKRVPEYIEDLLRGDRAMTGLEALLRRVPRCAVENLILRFNRTASRTDMQRLVDLADAVGEELMACLRDALRSGSANEAAEATGLFSRIDSSAVERWLPERLAHWPMHAQDRAVRLIAVGGAERRGSLLISLLSVLNPLLLSLAIDEIGLSEDPSCISTLVRIVIGSEAPSAGPFARLKAVEALGRLKAQEAADFLRGIAEARHMFHWAHPVELRLAAVQSMVKIDANWAKDFEARSGFTAKELALAPLDPLPNAKHFRRRRYARVRLSHPITAVATAGQDSYRLEIRGLSLCGGMAAGEKHLPPGTLVSLRIGSGMRPIRAQILMRDARAYGLGFEIVDMDLDERARLRKLLLENTPSAFYQEDGVVAQTLA